MSPMITYAIQSVRSELCVNGFKSELIFTYFAVNREYWALVKLPCDLQNQGVILRLGYSTLRFYERIRK